MMLHRRCLCDDHFGVDEALNEPGFDGKGLQVRGTFRLFVGNSSLLPTEELRIAFPPLLFFTHDTVPMGLSLLDTKPWEGKLHILSFESLTSKRSLIRLENLVSEHLLIDFNKLITQRFVNVVETNLDGFAITQRLTLDKITLHSREIKTFIVSLP